MLYAFSAASSLSHGSFADRDRPANDPREKELVAPTAPRDVCHRCFHSSIHAFSESSPSSHGSFADRGRSTNDPCEEDVVVPTAPRDGFHLMTAQRLGCVSF